jgi:DNA polymerase-3 subunit alpha
MENKQVEVTGLLIATKSVTTSRNEKMKFVTIEDRYGLIEVVIFPTIWKKISASLDKAMVLTIGGTVKNDSGQLIINAKWLKQF